MDEGSRAPAAPKTGTFLPILAPYCLLTTFSFRTFTAPDGQPHDPVPIIFTARRG